MTPATLSSSDCRCGMSSVTSVPVCVPAKRVRGTSTMSCRPPPRAGQLKQHILGSGDLGRRVGAQPVVDADAHAVDEAEEDRVAGGDVSARVYEPGTDLCAVPEADRLRVGSAGRDGSAGGTRKRNDPEHEKSRGGDSRRGGSARKLNGRWSRGLFTIGIPRRPDPTAPFRRRLRRRPLSFTPKSVRRPTTAHKSAATTLVCSIWSTRPRCGTCSHSVPRSSERVGRTGSMKWLLSPLNTYLLPSLAMMR